MWQSRVYTFLFRRILGPYLTCQSQKRLHTSLNVSLRAGNFELLDVEFDGQTIASKLNLHNDISIDKIHVKRMAVSLSLLYVNENGEVVENYDDGSVRLIARVSLDGVDIHIKTAESDCSTKSKIQSEKTQNVDVNPSKSGIGKTSAIRSYVQAAMDSLRLSLDMNDVSIRITSSENTWMSVNVSSITYRDEKDENEQDPQQSGTVLKKEINVDTVTLTVGENNSEGSHSEEVIRSEGLIVMKMIDKSDGKLGIERSFELIIDQELVVHAGIPTLQRISKVVNSFLHSTSDILEHDNSKCKANSDQVNDGNQNKGSSRHNDSNHSSEDDFDIKDCGKGLLANIIQQTGNENYIDNLKSKKMKDNATNRPLVNEENDVRFDLNISPNEVKEEHKSDNDVDDFFDSDDADIAHYRSMLEANLTRDTEKNEKSDTVVLPRYGHFYLRKAVIHLHLDKSGEDDVGDRNTNDTILFTVGGFDLKSIMKASQYSIDMELSVFHIDHMDKISNSISHLFHFVSGKRGDIYEDHGDTPSLQPVLLMSFIGNSFEDGENMNPNIDVEVSMSRIYCTCRYSIILTLIQSMNKFSGHEKLSKEDASSDSRDAASSQVIKCEVTCESLSVLVPLESDDYDVMTINQIFDRNGYKTANSFGELLEPAISLEANHLNLFYEKGPMSNEDVTEAEDLRVVASLRRSVVSFISPINSPIEDFDLDLINPIRRLDIFAFESEEKIDPDALIRLDFVNSCTMERSDTENKRRARKYFPQVIPLASVKASQHAHDDSFVPEPNKRQTKRVRGSDPQKAMLRSIETCERIIHFHIPSVAIDLTILEKDALIKVIKSARFSSSNSALDSNEDHEKTEMNKSSICLNLSCDQFTVSIHQERSYPNKPENDHFNHMLVCDGFKSHVFVSDSAVKHLRCLTNDMTLYEGVEEDALVSGQTSRTLQEMCEKIRKRRIKRNITASAIFFRSKMSHPLSPKTPAILFDAISRKEAHHTERALHISIYDMTHRYDYNSNWIERVSNIFSREHTNHTPVDDASQESITNLFLCLSDCNVDYTPPITFNTRCRTILRVGELRMTSNLVTPPGPIKVVKVTLADASIHITNSRVAHDLENIKLSCAKPVMNLFQHVGYSIVPKSFEDALSQQKFVRVATLDCLDSTTSLASSTIDNTTDVGCSVTLSMGRTCIYACKDSFLCFTESINELVANLTMPSSSELDSMWKTFNKTKHTHLMQNKEKRLAKNVTAISNNEGTTLLEVIDNGLFNQNALESDEGSRHERDLIDDFFTVGSRQAEPNRSYASSAEDQVSGNIDGWTTIHHSWESDVNICAGEEQSARWYTDEEIMNDKNSGQYFSSLILPSHTKVIIDGDCGDRRPNVFPRHIPMDPVPNPLDPVLNDMGAAKYAGTEEPPKVKLRVMIEDLSLHFRFFDGNDWDILESNETTNGDAANLLNALVNDEDASGTLFAKPNERYHYSNEGRSQKYFQFSFTGFKLRLDSFEDCPHHTLSSCMDMTLGDICFVETISGNAPVKLLGEWVTDEHLRDSNDGLMMMKMVSMHPDDQFSSDGKLMGDESRVTMEFLPIRFFIHQVALRFIRNFFRSDKVPNNDDSIAAPPEAFFPIFKVKPFNIKVDYKPKQVDTSALKDGSLVELLNVLPLEDMILRLSEVEMRNLTGWGSIISELACNWLQDVSSTQMHKFLTRTTPLHPFATVGDGMKQFLMIPLEEYQQKGDVKKGLKKGTKKLASVLAYETLGVGAKVTGFMAKKLGKKSSKRSLEADRNLSSPQFSTLPRSMNEVSDHAIESLTRGLKEANAKMIIIPYRQYQQSGTKGAMKSVVRGLPVAVCAPLSGAAEAVSYGLYGVRNQLRPDLREEEEASNRLHDLHF